MPPFDELLAGLLEEPQEVLGVLADVVKRGRMRADDLDPEHLDILTKYDLVVFLVQRLPRRPVDTWVYPSPMGLRMFATLEREAERAEPPKSAARKAKRRRGAKGSTR